MLDILTHVLKIIESDKDRCRLAITCRYLMKSDFYFDNLIDIEKIIQSQLFDKFTNIYLTNDITKLPKMVTHLTFATSFDQSIKNMIPNTVKNITFQKPKSWNRHHATLFDAYFNCYKCGTEVSDYFPLSVTDIIMINDISPKEIDEILKRQNLIFIFINSNS